MHDLPVASISLRWSKPKLVFPSSVTFFSGTIPFYCYPQISRVKQKGYSYDLSANMISVMVLDDPATSRV